MIGLGMSELLLLSLLGFGGFGLPLGMPPGPEDPLMAKIAPEDCMFYLSWSGMAKPDPASKNHTERLLAEQEVQRFVSQLETVLASGLAKGAGDDDRRKTIAAELPKIIRAVLTKPTAVFVGKVTLEGGAPDIEAGVVVSTGDDTADVMKSFASLEGALGALPEVETAGQKWKELPIPGGGPRLLFGFKGRYMILGVGEKSIDGIVKRAKTEPPKWLADAKKQLAVPRTSTVMYVNVKRGVETATAAIPFPPVRIAIDALGLGNVTSYASVSGLDDTGCVTRTLVAIDGKPSGVFTLAGGKPLTLKDLAPIPADATLAAVARVDLAAAFAELQAAIAKIEPRAKAEFDRNVSQLETEMGLSLTDDIFKALGDTWRVYNSPSDGGLVVTGLTGVVNLRDRDRVVKAMDKIEQLANQFAKRRADGGGPGPRGRTPRHVTIKHFEHAGQKVYFMNFVGAESPIAPAWCATDKEFVIATYPSHVKAYLSRTTAAGATPIVAVPIVAGPNAAKPKTLADVPEVARLFGEGTGPVALVYQDTAEITKLAYPLLQIGAQFAASELQREGIDVDISLLPSAPALVRHLRPGVTTVTQTTAGIEITSRQSVPVNLGAAPLLLPAVFLFQVREQRRFAEPHEHELERGFDKPIPRPEPFRGGAAPRDRRPLKSLAS